MFRIYFSIVFSLLALCFSQGANANILNDDLKGTYNGVLLHEESNFYQYARITIRTVNIGGHLKVSGNVRVYFGAWDSNEFLSYEFPDVPLNPITRQLSFTQDQNDVSLIGNIQNGAINGEWFSTIAGRVGTFVAQKDSVPTPPEDATLVRTLSGYYRGSLKNTNPQSNLPERISMSFVTTQEVGPEGPSIRITGNTRFYIGDFNSQEYFETRLSNIQFNFYTRYLTAKTEDYGITFKGTLSLDGEFKGVVLSDGLGEVGEALLKVYP